MNNPIYMNQKYINKVFGIVPEGENDQQAKIHLLMAQKTKVFDSSKFPEDEDKDEDKKIVIDTKDMRRNGISVN